MRTGIVLLLALAMLAPAALGITPLADEALGGDANNRYVVGFYKDPFLKEGQTYAGERIVAVDHDLLYVIVQVRDHTTFSTRVRLDDNVRYMQWDNPAYAVISLVPNDARYGDAGHWGSKKIGAEQAWDVTTGSTAVKVAMIDSGLNKGHEDITGSRVLAGYDYHNNDADPNDESGCSYHGTHTTGTAGATINNAKGIAGVSQHTILPFKALGSSFFGCTGSSSGLANALKAAGDQGAHVSSNSWGGGGVDSLLNDAIQYAHDRGVIHIAAAGNSGPCTNCVSEPWKSKASIVTIVASTTETDGQSSFSSEGAEIDVSAPGSNILSTTSGTTGYGSLSGTSMATPHVAGVAALLKAVNPSWTFSQVDGQLKSTSVDLGTAGHDHDFGVGRINAAAALGGGTPPPAACGDGLDNDGDGLTDYPNDPGCSSSSDTDETNAATGCSGGPANNCFASPTSVAAGGQTLSQSTTGATTESGEPSPCAGIANTVWFTWTPSVSGTATFDTVGSAYDTALAVYTGSTLTGLTNRGCNDDISSTDQDSRLSLSVTAGTNYRIQVGGYNGATGSLTFRVTAPTTSCGTPANNNFACATGIASRPYSNTQSTSGATLESGEPRPCGSIGGTVWYTWTPSASGTYTVDTSGSNFDTVLAIYTGSTLTGLTNRGCNDDISSSDLDSRLTLSFTAGTTYRIQVGGYNGATGSTAVLRIS